MNTRVRQLWVPVLSTFLVSVSVQFVALGSACTKSSLVRHEAGSIARPSVGFSTAHILALGVGGGEHQ